MSPVSPLSSVPMTLVDALKETFAIQAQSPVEILKVTVVDNSALSDSDIVAAIGLHSSEAAGTAAICFPDGTFLGVVNRMLGENYSKVDAENVDAAGELMNIIYASARVRINQAGHDFTPAIPTVTRGTGVRISHGGATKVAVVECRCDHGPFRLEVSMRGNGKHA